MNNFGQNPPSGRRRRIPPAELQQSSDQITPSSIRSNVGHEVKPSLKAAMSGALTPRFRWSQWPTILDEVRIQFSQYTKQNHVNPDDLKGSKEFSEIVNSALIANPDIKIDPAELPDLVEALDEWYFGSAGVLGKYLEIEGLEEVIRNPNGNFYLIIRGTKHKVPSPFASEQEALEWLQREFGRQNKNINQESPSADGRLEDGSRIHANIPPQSVDGASITIRKFRPETFTMEDLVKSGWCTNEWVEFIKRAVTNNYNIMVVGSTGSGKTTSLNTFGALIPPTDRMVVIEDTHELRIELDDIVYLQNTGIDNTSERGKEKGKTIRDGIRDALRMRPERIIIGEVRGAEAYDLLVACQTGHTTFGTYHAGSAREAIGRLEGMAAASREPVENIRDMIAWNIDLIIMIEADKNPITQEVKRHVKETWQFFHRYQIDDRDQGKLKEYAKKGLLWRDGIVWAIPIFVGEYDEDGAYHLVKKCEPLRIAGKDR